MIYEAVVEKLLNQFTSGGFADEVSEAKREFFEDAGIINDESAQFEMRMAQFLDWYIFTRELSEHRVPPVQYAIHDVDFEKNDDEKRQLEDLINHRHSLFEFLKAKDNDIYVKDLFEGKKYVLKNSQVHLGFNRDELFEARIIPSEENYIFASGFCFHPGEVRKFILKEVKKVKKLAQADREALMLRLLKMRYKHEQYSHIRLDFIYTNESKLKF